MSSKRYFCLAAVFLMGAMSIAHAQGLVRATIPFDFVASGKSMPAGTYIFRDALPYSDTQLAILDGKGHGVLASAATLESNDIGNKLIFRKYGESYFLADVFSPAGRLHFAPGRTEAKLAQFASVESIAVAVGE
jgi:hypothetical protein